jgi:undecaprenyl diphosphate synthase
MKSLLTKQLIVVVKGRVQGVFFRRGAKKEAERLGLTGYTRNLPEGTVGIVVEGEEQVLKAFLVWCYRGPFFARVTSLSFDWAPATRAFQDFNIIRSGGYVPDKIFALKHLKDQFFVPDILPQHVAIIPDGNRRWAKGKKWQAFEGHKQGLENTFALLDEAARLKIPYFTFWGFSTENWKRDSLEVDYLMTLFRNYLGRLRERLFGDQIRFRHFGRRDRLPKDIISSLERLEASTSGFQNGSLGLALDYGGRDEILRAVNKLKNHPGEVSEAAFEGALDTRGFPDPDLIIRTSGEQRISGLMPWQGTYSELYFANELFPDFGVPQFQTALADYSRRKRNFGA